MYINNHPFSRNKILARIKYSVKFHSDYKLLTCKFEMNFCITRLIFIIYISELIGIIFEKNSHLLAAYHDHKGKK